MVPCEFRCWGQYLSWQFTIGLCATLARSRNERPDTFACFLWPAQYRMGRAYSLQKLNGRVVAGGFAVGKTPALSARRNRRMPVKEQGFSLLEVNRPGFPGECFICELRLPDHRFRWKHNKLFLLLPEEYGQAFPAIVDCYTSPPT